MRKGTLKYNSFSCMLSLSYRSLNLSLANVSQKLDIRSLKIISFFLLFGSLSVPPNISIHYQDKIIHSLNTSSDDHGINLTCTAYSARPAVNLTWLINGEVTADGVGDLVVTLNPMNEKMFDSRLTFTYHPPTGISKASCTTSSPLQHANATLAVYASQVLKTEFNGLYTIIN